MKTVKKMKKILHVNIFLHDHFKNIAKKWNSVFTISNIPASSNKTYPKKWFRTCWVKGVSFAQRSSQRATSLAQRN